MAAGSGAELVVAHVRYVPPLPYAGEPVETIAALMKEDKCLLATSVAEATKLSAKRVSDRSLEGVPWDQIVSAAQDEAFDLIVIGTHGRTGLSRFLLGSIAEKVVRHAPCSVLIARTRGDTPPFRSVLCPIDFSEESHEALHRAGELVSPDGKLTLMHAIELPATYRAALAPELLAEADQRATRTLEQWAAELGPQANASISTTMGMGSPAAQALAVVEEDPTFDLIAVGSHGRTGIRRALLGSVAEKLVRHAPCSVLVARSPDTD